MLTTFDDYPVHQTADPVAVPASGDRNVYDRYFFNGHSADGRLMFAAALGLYPNRSVMDAAWSVLRDGVQTSLHASRRAPLERSETRVGPIAVEVLEPLRRLRVTVDDPESGLRAELTFTGRSEPVEEPRFTAHAGTRLWMDSTRMTQFGRWSGWLEVDGRRLAVTPAEVVGCRDRSWGIRSVGEPEGGAPGGPPQFFWLWAPLSFEDVCTHLDVNEYADGRRWHSFGVVRPDGPAPVQTMASVSYALGWRPGTRRADSARLVLTPPEGPPEVVELETLATFQMLGLGYLHPEWGHGRWKGEAAQAVERWQVDELEPLDPRHVHVQQLVRARWGDRTGVGVLEQLVLGPHLPSGLSGLLDGAGG